MLTRLAGATSYWLNRMGDTMRGTLTMAAGQVFRWASSTKLSAPADGELKIDNNTGTGSVGFVKGGLGGFMPTNGAGVRALIEPGAIFSYLSSTLALCFGNSGANELCLGSGGKLGWSSTTTAGAGDTQLARAAAGVVSVRDGAAELGQLRLMQLATVQLDLNVTTKQTIYTVPAGKTLIPIFAIMRDQAAACAAGTSWGLGRDANASDFFSPTAYGALLNAAGKALYMQTQPPASCVVGAAGDVFGLKVTVAEAAQLLVTVDLYGYLV